MSDDLKKRLFEKAASIAVHDPQNWRTGALLVEARYCIEQLEAELKKDQEQWPWQDSGVEE